MRRRRCGRRSWLTAYSYRFHDLNTRAVRIVQVGLTLAVYAGFERDRTGVLLAVSVRVEFCDGRDNIGHFETEMVRGSAPVGWRRLLLKHELDIVLAVGNLEIDPRQD